MESNNQNLEPDMGAEETMPEIEPTAPEAQDAPELSDVTPPQAELVPDEAVPPETAAEEPAAASETPATTAPPEMVEAEPEAIAEESAAVPEISEAAAAPETSVTTEPPEVVEAEPEAVAEKPAAAPETPATSASPEAAEAPPEPVDDAPFKRGDIVEGTVLETSPTEVLVDLGEGVTGVIASRELERMDRAAIEALQPGKAVTAYVLKTRGADGHPVLSLARAEEENNWRLAQEHFENRKVYFSKIAGYNKGGLIVRFGKVRGFVPASQVSRERQQRASGDSPEARWGSMVGEDIAVKVVEIDRSRNRLILSERAAAREWREQQKADLLKTLSVGEIRKGRVISVADFGAFVDLGGADGLVHLTELSWKHVTHPREVLQVGQEVEVEIISIDPERKRIGLSMKRLERDPWQEVVEEYYVGQLVQATVTKLTKFGAFARLVAKPEIEGLIHISELADYRVSHPREVVLVGDVLTLRIVKIEPDDRRLGLSLRQVDSPKYMDQDWQAIADEMEETLDAAAPADEAHTPAEEEVPTDEADVPPEEETTETNVETPGNEVDEAETNTEPESEPNTE